MIGDKKYVVFEGIHGSGKTSLAKMYAERSQREYFHMPEESDYFGATIRKLITEREIVGHREVTGLVYAAFANRFHYTHDQDDVRYVLDRHSFVTGLVFQQDIPQETRKHMYGPGLRALCESGVVVYVRVDRDIAYQRMQERNKQVAAQGGVWKDKSKDIFFEDFERLSELYDNSMLGRLEEWGVPYCVIDNNGTLEESCAVVSEKIG